MTSAVVCMYLLCVLVCVVYAVQDFLVDRPQAEGTCPVQIKLISSTVQEA